MEYISYEEAVSFWNSENSKIKVVVFALENCNTCDDFLPDVFEKIINEEYSDHFEVVNVDIFSEDILFPPVNAPTIYFKIPNTDEPMPLVRTGGVPEVMLRKDLDTMIKIKDEGLSIDNAFSATSYMEVNSWIQRQMRF